MEEVRGAVEWTLAGGGTARDRGPAGSSSGCWGVMVGDEASGPGRARPVGPWRLPWEHCPDPEGCGKGLMPAGGSSLPGFIIAIAERG